MMTYRDLKRFGFSHHDIRAFYATSVVNTPGLNIKDAALVLGHNSVLTTQRYIRSDYTKVSTILLEQKL
jgi:site-specific recombinase XerC